jgi:hypothetical protein
MRSRTITIGSIALAAIATLGRPASSRADVNGFGDFSGFSINQHDSGAAPTVSLSADSINLTNDNVDESRTIFANQPQPISQFKASFEYEAGTFGNGYGAAFVIQDNPAGAQAVGGTSGGLGYAGIGNSVAVSLEFGNDSNSYSGLYTNGNVDGGSTSTAPVEIFSGDPILVTLTYNGSILDEEVEDLLHGSGYNADYIANIPSIVGSSQAYVGLSASTNYLSGAANQSFTDFQFTSSVPEPASATILGVGSIAALMRRRRR